MQIHYWFLYLVCLLFIISGTFNYGLTRFFFAIPFFAAACFLSVKLIPNRWLLYGTAIFVLIAIAVNLTLEKNPFVFPVLDGGYIEVHKDGYYKSFPGGGIFVEDEPCIPTNQIKCDNNVVVSSLPAGTRLPVVGVRVEPAGVGLKNVVLITESGMTISQDNIFIFKDSLSTNKPIESTLLNELGSLMLYPSLPLLLLAILL